MKRDEFNRINIKNVKDVNKREFGKTQKTEYSSFDTPSYNKTTDSELNKTAPSSNEVKEASSTEVKHVKHTNVIDAIKSVSTSSTASTVVAATSVVAVTTVSTLVGINIFINARCNFEYLYIGDTEISYTLELTDTNNDQYILSLSNSEYKETKDLVEGLNEGYFDGLMPQNEYKIEVINVSYNNYVLYEKTIVTEAADTPLQDPIFNSFSITQSLPFSEKYVEIYVDFTDTDKVVSDFTLELLMNENVLESVTFLPNNDTQKAYISKELSEDIEYQYRFYYLDSRTGEDVLYEEGNITFINIDNGQLEFSLSNEADVLSGDIFFTITLSGATNLFGDCYLVLTDTSLSDEVTREFVINYEDITSGEEMSINVIDEISSLWLREHEFDYKLAYTYKNELVSDDQSTCGHVKFKDKYSRISQMNSFEIVYKDGNILAFKVDYQDGFGLFSDFTVHLNLVDTSSEVTEFDFSLDKTTDVQERDLSSFNEGYDFSNDSYYTYEFSYFDSDAGDYLTLSGETYVENKLSFDGLDSTFNVTTFGDEKYYIPVVLYYNDYYEVYQSFTIYITNMSGSNSLEKNLEMTHNWQYLEVTELYSDVSGTAGNLDPAETIVEISYEVKAIDDQDNVTPQVGSGTISKDGTPNLTAAYIYENIIDASNPIMSLYLVYIDYDKITNDMSLVFEIDDDTTFTFPFNVENKNLTEYVSLDLSKYENYLDLLEALRNYPTMVKIVYNDGDGEAETYIYEEKVNFTIV